MAATSHNGGPVPEAGGKHKANVHSAPPENGQQNPHRVSSTASSQHKHEQELLLGFTVPAPPVSTTQLTLAAGQESENPYSRSPEAPRTLWMGDLDPWLDETGIVNLWWQVLNQHVSVKLIRPRSARLAPPDQPGLVHSGYCFVEFPLFEAAQQALGLNGQLLPDIAMPSQQQFPDNPDNQKKYFRLNWALGATLTAPIVESPEYSLFVGDLSASTTEAHLLLFFQKQFPDSIRTVRVMTDPVSGKSRCFGFVRFSDELERQRALVEMDGVWFGGRPLRVANATPRAATMYRKHPVDLRQLYSAVPQYPPTSSDIAPSELMYLQQQQQISQPQQLQQQPGQVSVPPPVQQAYYTPAPLMGAGGSSDMGYGSNVPSLSAPHYVDPNNTTVFVGGLLSDVNDQTLYTLFKPFGSIIQIKIPPGKNCGFVKYSSREEAEDAILNMEGFVIGGHRVRLGWGRISGANKKLGRPHHHPNLVGHLQMQAMSLGYDPASIYAAQGYPPVAMPMYHYMANPEVPPDFDHAGVSEYNAMGNPPIIRSRSLDHEIDGAPSTSHPSTSEYVSDQLAHNFDTLSLDAASQYHGTFNPYNPYAQVVHHTQGPSSSLTAFVNHESPAVPQSTSNVSLHVKDTQLANSENATAATTHDLDTNEPEKETHSV